MRTLLLVVALVLAAGCGGGDDAASTDTPATPTAAPTPTPEAKEPAEVSLPAGGVTPSPDPSAEPVATEPVSTEPVSTEPVATEPAAPPTEGLPGGRYVRIDTVSLDQPDSGPYSVAFEPFNFVPLIGPGTEDFHVHFFFDTVDPEDAGTNGQPPGEWFLYDGPSPFTGYAVADRPEGATRMCALVADAAHAITVGTGNCVDLP